MDHRQDTGFEYGDVRLDPLGPSRHIEYVVRRMRDNDKREVYAARFSNSPDDLMDEIWWLLTSGEPGGFETSWVVSHPRRPDPIGLLLFRRETPVCLSPWFIATDQWKCIAKPLTRWLCRQHLPLLASYGWRRMECRALADYTVTRRWLEWFGFEVETGPMELGRAGENYIQYGLNLQARYGKCASEAS